MDYNYFLMAFGGGLSCGVIVLYQYASHKKERDDLALEVHNLRAEVNKLNTELQSLRKLFVESIASAKVDTRPNINLTAQEANIGGDVVGGAKGA